MKLISKEEANIIKKYYNEYIKKYNPLFFLYMILASTSKTLMLLMPFLNSLVIDNVINGTYNNIIKILFVTLILYLISMVISFGETYISVYLSSKITLKVRQKTFDKIMRLDLSIFNKKKTGEYMSLIEGDVDVIGSFYFSSITAIVMNLITIIISGFFIFRISITLSAVGLISFPVNMIIYWVFGKKMKTIQTKVRNMSDIYTSQIQEALLGIQEIKGLRIEKAIINKYNKSADSMFKLSMESGITGAIGSFIQFVSSSILKIIQTALACFKLISGTLTIGSYVAFSNYLNQFVSSLQRISAVNVSLQTSLVSMKRLDELKDELLEQELTNPISLDLIDGKIEISNVSFFYNQNQPVLENLNLSINENEIVTIVGSSGAGKTTLFNLIMRFYEIQHGLINIDGININKLSLDSIRNNITYIQQDPFLFNDSIKNNLLLAKEDATLKQLEEACQQAFLYDFINQLPNGFDTLIGEQGANLSGGQRQRLAIARGILKNTKIFLFDEVTSDLDGEAEEYLVDILSKLSKEHTIIMIAHRISTVINMPRILVLNEGKIIDEGVHFELLNSCDTYRKLFKDTYNKPREELNI